jgi:hypothetical protein
MEEENAKWEQGSNSRVRFETYWSKFMAIEIGKNPIIYNESHWIEWKSPSRKWWKVYIHNKNDKSMILNNTYMYKLVIMKST